MQPGTGAGVAAAATDSTGYICVLGMYCHVNKSQQLILRADTWSLASLTSACYSVLLWFTLGIVVMDEMLYLDSLSQTMSKKKNQTTVTVNYPPTFLVLVILSHFIPDNRNGWLLPTWV